MWMGIGLPSDPKVKVFKVRNVVDCRRTKDKGRYGTPSSENKRTLPSVVLKLGLYDGGGEFLQDRSNKGRAACRLQGDHVLMVSLPSARSGSPSCINMKTCGLTPDKKVIR